MYNTKEKCKELAEKFKQICAERGTTPYKIAQKSGLSSGGYNGTESRYPDDTLQPTWYFGQ